MKSCVRPKQIQQPGRRLRSRSFRSRRISGPVHASSRPASAALHTHIDQLTSSEVSGVRESSVSRMPPRVIHRISSKGWHHRIKIIHQTNRELSSHQTESYSPKVSCFSLLGRFRCLKYRHTTHGEPLIDRRAAIPPSSMPGNPVFSVRSSF